MVEEALVGVSTFKDRDLLLRDPYNSANLAQMLRDAMSSGGLGSRDRKKPLLDIIQPGMSVLLKPNWVLHRNKSGKGLDSLITHPNFIEAVLNEVAKCEPSKVIIADAPIQGCIFDNIVRPEWVTKLRGQYSFPIEVVDFRRTVISNGSEDLSKGVSEDRRGKERYILFDLAAQSTLEAISNPSGKFRVTMYNPKYLTQNHQPGRHRYLLSKELFEVDVILNLPKLKTHKKAGITGALKNLVGINGNKDYLPHHRVGGAKLGGDCYPGLSLDRRVMEFFLDRANEHINSSSYKFYRFPARLIAFSRRRFGLDVETEGGWYGNDTVWRMTLDLNLLLRYGNKDGSISSTPIRKWYSITDAIISGDTNGPLEVEPLPLGVVTFASSPAYADLVHTYLMRLDWKKIHSIREAFALQPLHLVDRDASECKVVLDGKEVTLEHLSDTVGQSFRPSRGWVGHIEKENHEYFAEHK